MILQVLGTSIFIAHMFKTKWFTKTYMCYFSSDKMADLQTNRVLHLGQVSQMWNAVYREHSSNHPGCNGFLEWDVENEQRRGLASRLRLTCEDCGYISGMYSLYEEVETTGRGRKAAKMNHALQAVLAQTPIGPTSVRKLFLGCNIPAPCLSCLQDTANRVLPEITKENKSDMENICKKLKTIQEENGVENSNTIDVQVDSCYNNPFYSGIGNTPFQPATQVVTAVAEDVTDNHYIVGVNVENKLCSNGKHLKVLRETNDKHFCCDGNCGATIPMEATIGNEKAWSKKILTSLKLSSDIEVKAITTDPDSAAYRAAGELYEENVTSTEPEHFLDTRHFSQNHRKTVKKNTDLLNCMPAENKAERSKLLNRLSLDLVDRCNKELAIAMKQYDNDVSTVKSKMTYAMDAIAFCYTGYHDLCKKHSFACKGGDRNWIDKSTYLPNDFSINRSTENVRALRSMCMYRLSGNAIEKTRQNRNTQKVESLNRVIRRSLPNNVTFCRNAVHRVHSAVHSVNNGNSQSLLTILSRLGCQVPQGSRIHRSLKSMQKNQFHNQQRKKLLIKYKIKRQERRKFLYELYERHQEEICYQKSMLLQSQATASCSKQNKTKSHCDHNYFKSSKKRLKSNI